MIWQRFFNFDVVSQNGNELACNITRIFFRLGTSFLIVLLLTVSFVLAIQSVVFAQGDPTVSIEAGSTTTPDPIYQDSANAYFTIDLTAAFSSETEIVIQVTRFNAPGNPSSVNESHSTVTISVDDSQDLVHAFMVPFNQQGVYQSVRVTVSNQGTGYQVNINANVATVHRPTGTSPLATVTTSTSTIIEGGVVDLGINLSHTPDHTVYHDFTISWSASVQVKSVSGVNSSGRYTENTSGMTSVTVSARVNSGDTSNTQSNRIIVTIGALTSGNTSGTITASLVKEDPLNPSTKEDPIYDPIYHDTKFTTSVTVTEAKIEWSWQGDFNGTEAISTSYTAREVNLTITKAAGVTLEIEFELKDGEMQLQTQAAQPWSGTVTALDWTATNNPTTGMTSLSFTATSGISFNGITSGESRTAIATIRQKRETEVLVETMVIVTLRHPEYTMNFSGAGQGTTSRSITSVNSGNYPEIIGMGSASNLAGLDGRLELELSVTESSEGLTPLTDMVDKDSDLETVQFNLSGGNSDIPGVANAGPDFRYGTWYFEVANGSYIKFVPNPLAIDALDNNVMVTSTATAKIKGTSASVILTVTITGNGPSPTTPELSITAENKDNEVIEGKSAWFKISSTVAATRDLDIGIDVDDSGNFLASTAPSSFTLEAGLTAAFLELPTKTITPDPRSVRITVNLNAGVSYGRNQANSSAYVDVQDVGPALSFNTTSVTITEGGQISFTIRADEASTDAIEIPIYYLDGVRSTFPTDESGVGSGDVLSNYLPSMVILDANTTRLSVEIPTIDDNSDESDGQVLVGIGRATNSRFELSTVNLSNRFLTVSATVRDNDGLLFVSVVTDSPSVIEGDTAIFRIIAPYAVSIDQKIQITVMIPGGHLVGTRPDSVTIKAGESEATLELPTRTLSTDNPAFISVTPFIGTAAFINIVDVGPVVNLSQVSASIAEGAIAELNFTVDPAPVQEDIIIPLAFEETEFKIDADDLPESVTIKAGESGTKLQLQTIDNDIRDSSNQFMVYAHRTAGSRFEINSSSSVNHPTLGRVASSTFTFIENDGEPEFSIVAMSDTVLEGDAARFKISSTRGYASNLPLNLIVTRLGDVVHGSAGLTFDAEDFSTENEAATTVDVAATETEFIYEVPTKFINMVASGTIKVEIQDSAGYGVDTDSDNDEATVTVNDAGPVVSIEHVGSANVEEGGMVQLAVSAPAADISEEVTIPIAYEAIERIGVNPPREVRLTSSNPSVNVVIPVKSDSKFNPGQRELITLFQRPPGGNFEWNENLTVRPSGAAVITTFLTDNQDPPELSISVAAPSVTEGDLIRFNLVRSNEVPRENDLNVEIELQDVGGFIGGSRTVTTEFKEGMNTAALEIPTFGNGESGGNGTVVAKILDHAIYGVSAFPNNIATVTIGGTVSTVSVANPQTVNEGEDIVFTLTVTPAPSGGIDVPVAISDGMRSTFGDMEILGLGNLLGATIPSSVTIAGDGTGTLTIPTTSNNLNELDVRGVVQVEFQPPTGSGLDFGIGRTYRVGVLDIDSTPEISISPPPSNIREGEPVVYTLSASSRPAEDIHAKITVTIDNFRKLGAIPKVATIPAGQTTGVLEIPTKSDGVASQPLMVTVTLEDGAGYSLVPSAKSADAEIVDAGPLISIISVGGNSVVEGSEVVFQVTRPTATGPALTIDIFASDGVTSTFPDMRIRGSGNLFKSTPDQAVTIPKNSSVERFSIHLTDDGLYGTPGMFQVVLHLPAMAPYELASQTPLEIMVTDRQTEPVISLEASNSAVEGDSINVSVIASVGTTSYLVIGVTVTESAPGTIAGSLPTSVALPAGATRTDLVLPTLTDGEMSTRETVTVTLNAGSGYSVSSVTDKNTVNVTLSNARSIVTVAGPSDRDLTEGESITFTLTISSRLDNDTVIPVSYSDGTTSTFSGNRTIGSGDVLGDVLEPTVTIDRNSLSGSITIPTVQDAFDEDMGIVLVQFHRQQGSPYEFMQSVSNTSTTGNTLPEERNDVLQQFVVNDDDTPPVLSVEAEFDEIFEGFPAVFKFTSEGQSSADFPVNVMLTQTSSFLTERNTDVVTFKGRSNETTVNLMTDSGAFDNFEGSITLTIQNSSTKVGDNTPYYTVASEPVDANIAVIDVNDNDISVVEVSVVHNAINEGEVAQFTVTRSIGSGFALFVKVSVDQGDNDFIQGSPESTVVIPPNSSTMPYMVATIDDAKDENSGSVTVVLAEGMGYTLGNSYSNSVLVNDNDAPEISISMEELSVEEGNPARFTLTSVSMVDTSIRVRFSSIQNGDFVLWRMPSFVEIATGSDNAVIEIQTTDDNQREENGSISIMLQESVNGEYHLSGESGATRAAVTVTDNDGASGGSPPGVNYTIAGLALEMVLRESSGPAIPGQSSSPVTELPTISVESALPVIEEGSVAVFSVTMQETSKVTLIVEYLIEQEGEFVDRQSTGPVVLEAGRQSVDIEIQTIDDNQAEPDGTVTVVLSESTGYLVAEAPNNAATVKISDAADRKQRSDAIFHANSVVLPELAWTMGANSLDAVVARNVLGSETSIGLMGQSSLRELLVAGGEAMNDEGLNWRSALLDSSFSIGLYPEGGSVESATVWGIGDTRNLHRSVYGTARSWKGEHSGGHFGFDTQLGKNGLIGMATSFTASSIDYAGNNEPALEIDMVSTGIQPYLGWKSTNGKTTLVVTVGHGPGTIQITETDYATEKATTTFNLVGVSASRHVSIWGNGIPSKQHGLNLSGKAWYVQQAVRANNSYVHALQVDAGQFRLTADAKNKWNTTSNSTLIPSATLGLVGNKLQSQSSIDVELGTGVEYNSPIGLELSGRGELLVSNIDRTKGRQIKGRLRYYQDKDGSGLGIEITPAWSDGVGPLQNPAQDQIPFSVPERREKSERVQLESEIGYGFAGVDERLRSTPFSGLDLNSDRGSKVRLGLRFETDRDFRLEILGSESLNSTENPVREVAMEGSYKW